jgi:hypothetical protein
MTSLTHGLIKSGFDIRVTGPPGGLQVVLLRDGEEWVSEIGDGHVLAILPVLASGIWKDAAPNFEFNLLQS